VKGVKGNHRREEDERRRTWKERVGERWILLGKEREQVLSSLREVVIRKKGGRNNEWKWDRELDEKRGQELPCVLQVSENNRGEKRYDINGRSSKDHCLRLGPCELRGVPVTPAQQASEHLQPDVAHVDVKCFGKISQIHDQGSKWDIVRPSRYSKCINIEINHIDSENIQFNGISSFWENWILSKDHHTVWGIGI
jgi:hypothetical protein